MEIEITATVLVVEVILADSIDQAVHDFMATHDGQLPDTVEGRHVLGVCGECSATIFDGDTYDFLQVLGTPGDHGNAVWTCELCAEAEAARAEERGELPLLPDSEVAAVSPGIVISEGTGLVNDDTVDQIIPGENADGFTLV